MPEKRVDRESVAFRDVASARAVRLTVLVKENRRLREELRIVRAELRIAQADRVGQAAVDLMASSERGELLERAERAERETAKLRRSRLVRAAMKVSAGVAVLRRSVRRG